ncbi:hypothetical protein D3C86_1638650 [compost metagenome]
MFVDLDIATRVEFHRGVFQAQVVQHRPASGGVEHAIGFQHAAILQRREQAAVGLFVDAFDIAVELQIQAALAQLVAQVLAHRAVEAPQEQLAAIEQRGLGAEAVENRGELHGDIATANHQHPLGQLFEEEGFIRADGMLMPRNLRDMRPAAGGDEDVFGAVTLTAQLHAMRIEQARMTLEQGYAAVYQQVAVDAVEPFDFTVFVGDQGRPIELRFTG